MEQGNVFRLTATEDAVKGIVVSIPLEQGNVFRLYLPLFHQLNQQVSIPLEQGNVFRLLTGGTFEEFKSLNPFGTGQCLSTKLMVMSIKNTCLNPFGTGQCLSTAVGC